MDGTQSPLQLDHLLRESLTAQVERARASDDLEQALLELADDVAALVSSDARRAIDVSSALVALVDQLEVPAAQSRARRARARALAVAGRFEDSLAVCNEAMVIAEQNGEPVEAGRARLASMHALCELGMLERATAAGEQARQLFLEAQAPEMAGRADINLGITYHRQDKPGAAVECFDRARELIRHEPGILASLENSRGEALVAINDFPRAEQAFSRALELFEQVGHQLNAGIAEGNLADLANRQGRLHRALEYFERALRRLDADELAVHRARLLAEQADAKAVLGLHELSLRTYRDALPQLETYGLALEAARARMGMGRVLAQLSRRTEAETAFAAAATAFAELGHATLRAQVDLARASLAMQQDRLHEARRLASTALAVLHDRPADAASARLLLAELALRQGETELAEAELAAGLAIARDLHLAPLLADLLHVRGEVCRRMRRLPDAIRAYRQSIAQIERIRGSLQAERFRTAFVSERSSVYQDLLRAVLEHGGEDAVNAAFLAAEQAKSRSLLEQVNRAVDLDDQSTPDRSDPVEVKIYRELQAVHADLNALYSRLGDAEVGAGVSGPATEWRHQVREREQRLESLESRLAFVRGSASLYARPISLNLLQGLLGEREAVIQYAVCRDELVAFHISRHRARIFRQLAPLPAITERIERMQFQIDRALRPGASAGRRSDRMLADTRRELQALHELLLEPMGPLLADLTRLTVIPHGPLHLLPFAALHDGQRHLIQRFEVNTAPSASVLHHLLSGRPQDGGERLLVAVPDAQTPMINEEAREIAGALGLTDEQQLLQDAATVEAVTERLPGASMIHLACHGRFARENPMGSGLRLADRWMTVRDIYALRLQADLITLSGCETGLAAVDRGDEQTGLVRAFLAAGARTLLVSLWRVADRSTMEMMCDFYDRWHTVQGAESRPGPGKAAALREVQCRMLERQPHPAFWAPFQLVGQP